MVPRLASVMSAAFGLPIRLTNEKRRLMEDKRSSGGVWAGIDTHKDTHALCVLDNAGKVVFSAEFSATAAGHNALAAAIGDPKMCALVAVEGCGSYGSRLADRLIELGYPVVEATRPKKESRGQRGKSDAIDAERAAERARTGKCVPVKRSSSALDELSLLFARREQLVRQRSALLNHVDGELARAPEYVQAKFVGLSGAARMEALLASRPRISQKGHVWFVQLREAARMWKTLDEAAEVAAVQMRKIVEQGWPKMLTVCGMDVLTAVPLILLGGANPERFGTEAGFAKACGTAPIPASSGKNQHYRLNRGGNRQANRALTTIARTRKKHDKRTCRYIQRRISEGKTEREVERCLKRYIAREVYAILLNPSMPPHPGPALAKARKSIGLTQAKAASDLGTSTARLSYFESKRKRYDWLEPLYLDYIENMLAACGKKLEIKGLQT